MVLIKEVYKATSQFSQKERYGLSSQIQRAAVSIPGYIAEGYGRKSKQDYFWFLQISVGSLFELQTQLEIANNLNYITHEIYSELDERCRVIDRIMSSLIRNIKH